MKRCVNFVTNTIVIIALVLMIDCNNPLVGFAGCLVLGSILITAKKCDKWWSLYLDTWMRLFARVGIK